VIETRVGDCIEALHWFSRMPNFATWYSENSVCDGLILAMKIPTKPFHVAGLTLDHSTHTPVAIRKFV
jgi:hypothetical protein